MEGTHFDKTEMQDLPFFVGQTQNIKAANFMCGLQVAQLHHELNLKDELLQFYTNAAEESEDESSSSPPWAFVSPSPSRSISSKPDRTFQTHSVFFCANGQED